MKFYLVEDPDPEYEKFESAIVLANDEHHAERLVRARARNDTFFPSLTHNAILEVELAAVDEEGVLHVTARSGV